MGRTVRQQPTFVARQRPVGHHWPGVRRQRTELGQQRGPAPRRTERHPGPGGSSVRHGDGPGSRGPRLGHLGAHATRRRPRSAISSATLGVPASGRSRTGRPSNAYASAACQRRSRLLGAHRRESRAGCDQPHAGSNVHSTGMHRDELNTSTSCDRSPDPRRTPPTLRHRSGSLGRGPEPALPRGRTANAFADEPVTDEQIAAIYELVKWGPTAMNAQPLRVVLVRSDDARNDLVAAMNEGNRAKTAAAPLVAVLAADIDFHDEFHRTFPVFPGARDAFAGDEDARATAATLQLRAADRLLPGRRPRRRPGRRPDGRLRPRGRQPPLLPRRPAPGSCSWSTSATRASSPTARVSRASASRTSSPSPDRRADSHGSLEPCRGRCPDGHRVTVRARRSRPASRRP